MTIEIMKGNDNPVADFFSSSGTPETDDQPIIYAMNDNGYQVPCVDLEFARRLKRERDEAKQIISSALAALPVGYIPAHTAESIPNRIADLCNEIAKSERERDEAREETPCPHCETESYSQDERDYWKCGTIRYEEKCVVRTDLCNEREERKAAESKLAEAREQNAALRDIAERAINYLDQSYRDGFSDEASDLRYELDRLKEGAK
jgi:hypothetical protein